MTAPKQVWTSAEIRAAGSDFTHSLQSEASCHIVPLSRIGKLDTLGLNLVTVPPGGQAFPLHRHHVEDEWTYVLAGAARVRIGDTEHAMQAGEFVAFPAGGEPHCVHNASAAEPLTCLMGGVTVPADLVDFPELGTRIVKSGLCIDSADATAFTAFQFRAAPEQDEAER